MLSIVHCLAHVDFCINHGIAPSKEKMMMLCGGKDSKRCNLRRKEPERRREKMQERHSSRKENGKGLFGVSMNSCPHG